MFWCLVVVVPDYGIHKFNACAARLPVRFEDTWSITSSSIASYCDASAADRQVLQPNPKESAMDTSNQGFTVHDFNALNYVGTDALPKDQTQSHRLHEPSHMLSNIDPITGRDIGELAGHPFIVDGNMTMYFETEETRQAYLDMPTDHPFRLVDNPTDEGYAEG
jgi:hypothetical protein